MGRYIWSFYDDPARDYVFAMHSLLAGCAGIAAAMYLHLGWWSLAAAVALGASLELAMRTRYLAWISIVVGTAFSGGIGGVAGLVIAVELTSRRAIWWPAGTLGAVGGAWLAVDAYRKLLARRRAASHGSNTSA